ncbi:MAG: hypothetical protein LBB75_06845 [Oscillospiraceae bacterium]|nr:hypothetical protein [Oscillospiraceae bacterium]
MNTFSNFSSVNGWMLPGSGAWAARDTEDFYVDENGDLWVPCFCGEGETGSTGGSPGPAEGPPPAEAAAGEADARAEPARIEYAMDTGGDFIRVGYPEAILCYPGRSVSAGRASYPMGLLADAGKGSRWYYRGPHRGKVRLHVSQANMTAHMALWDPGDPNAAAVPENGVFAPGVELRYAVVLENARDTPAEVTVRRQGGSLGWQPNMAQLEYFRSEAEPPFTVEPRARKWLYLGRPSGDLAEPGPCKLVQDEARQVAVGTRLGHDAQFEVQADLEFSGPLTVTCFAYHEKGRVDFGAASMWPLPRQAGMPEAERLKGLFAAATGVSPVWQLDGHFLWAVDDISCGSPAALEIRAAHGPVPFAVPVAAPAGAPPGLDRMLFAPPPPPVSREIRGAPSRGAVYHQAFTVDNRGRRARRVRCYVTCGDPAGQACIFHANEGRALGYRACEDGPSLLVADITVPGGETRLIETYLIAGPGGGGLGHRLTADDVAA